MERGLIKKMQARIARDAAAARMLPAFVATGVVGLALLSTITLEFLMARDVAERLFRGLDGVLTSGEASLVPLIAAIFCLVSLAWFHWALTRIRMTPSGRVVFWVIAITALVTLAQPAITLLSDLRFGNTMNATPDAGLLLKNRLLTMGFLVRAIIILMAAITATVGLLMIEVSVKKSWRALRRGKDAKTIAEAVDDFDTGVEAVVSLKHDALAFNRDCASDYSEALVDGFMAMSNAVTQYENGPDDVFISPAQWKEATTAQFVKPVVPRDPKIAKMVESRLKQHSIDFELLPEDPGRLSAKARTYLVKYAVWLRQQANADAIYDVTVLKLEDNYA